MKKTITALLLILTLLFMACSTNVKIDTPGVPGAEVRLDGKPLGQTPIQIELSDAIWEDYRVEISKEGYETYRGILKKDIKVAPAIGGFCAWPFWLWAYGPESNQEFYLKKK